jgi:hypothetical protein
VGERERRLERFVAGQSERSEAGRAAGASSERRKGKLTSGPRLSAARVEGEGARRLVGLGRGGLWAVWAVHVSRERRRRARLAWAVGPRGVCVVGF